MKKYRLIFFGTPQFAVPALEALIKDERFDVIAVVTEPDRKSGRGNNLVFSPIKNFVTKYNKERDSSTGARNDTKGTILLLQPEKIQAIGYKLKAISWEVAVVAAYGQFIPKEILGIPKYGFVNIHPSLLPKYRGPSPIQAAILNGDKKTGVTIMKMDEKMDHGEIIDFATDNSQLTTINSEELSEKLSKLGAELLIKVLPDYLEGKIKPKPQDHTKATFTKLINKSDGQINWKEPVKTIERKIRAYFPWPGTYTFINSKRLKILKAHLAKSAYEVGAGDRLVLDKVQLEGKKPVSWQEFKRGYRHPIDFSKKI